jgi:hypothetical protein
LRCCAQASGGEAQSGEYTKKLRQHRTNPANWDKFPQV